MRLACWLARSALANFLIQRTLHAEARLVEHVSINHGRAHILVAEHPWQADHVFPHSGGGSHAADNYLPAHALCNNYRWEYTSEEFQHILKLGVWLRTQIERKTLGLRRANSFLAHEAVRIARRKPH